MSSNVALRMLDTFFRRWWLYVLPVGLCCLFAALSIVSQSDRYVSVGVLSASRDTLISNLSNLTDDSGFSFETPATVTSRRINEALRSDEFVMAVAERAGIKNALDSGLIAPDDVRKKVWASPDGESLLRVTAKTEDPQLSVRLTTATIDSFIEAVVEEDLSQSASTEAYYEDVAATYSTQVDEARSALDAYVVAHPEPLVGERDAPEQSEIDRLTAVLSRFEDQYISALSKAEDARLATQQARLDIEQRLRVVDVPSTPILPEPRLRAAAFTLALFGVLGSLISVGLVAVVTFLDQTVRSPDEIKTRFGLDVLATVPTVDLRRAVRSG